MALKKKRRIRKRVADQSQHLFHSLLFEKVKKGRKSETDLKNPWRVYSKVGIIDPKTTWSGHKPQGPMTKSISRLSQRTPISIQRALCLFLVSESSHFVSLISRLYLQEVARYREATLFEPDDTDPCLNADSHSSDVRQVNLRQWRVIGFLCPFQH